MTKYQIIELSKDHDRSHFQCGIEALDRYFQRQVSQDIRRKVAKCFVAVSDDDIIGYYTLASTSIPLTDLPEANIKKLPRYPLVPAAMLGRLAVSEDHHGKGIGGELIANAVLRSIRSDLACYAILVDAIDERAVRFYRHHQFTPFAEKPNTLFLPLAGLLV